MRWSSQTGGYIQETLGVADDDLTADGENVLNFSQAERRALALVERRHAEAKACKDGPVPTVRTAVEAYVVAHRARVERNGGAKARRGPLHRHVLATPLADKTLHELSRDDLQVWRRLLAAQDYSPSTVVRACNDLRAALNAAALEHHKRLPPVFVLEVKAGLAANGHAHSPVARDAQVLADSDVRRIISAAWEVDGDGGWEGDFARMIVVLAATGARFSQAARITVGDVQSAQRRIMVPASRKGRGGKSVKAGVPVGEDVIEVLRPAIAGRVSTEPLLVRWRHKQVTPSKWERVGRGPWKFASELTRPWAAVTARAELPAGIVPYALRHSSIVRGLREGLPVRLVAALHDTSSAMIEAHYSAFIVNALDEIAARAVVPLTTVPASVLPLRAVR